MPRDIEDLNKKFHPYNPLFSSEDTSNITKAPKFHTNILLTLSNQKQNIYKMDEEGTITNPPILLSQSGERENLQRISIYLFCDSQYRDPNKDEENAYLEAKEQVLPEEQEKQDILNIMLLAVGKKYIPNHSNLYEDFVCILGAYRKGVFNQADANIANNLKFKLSTGKLQNASTDAVKIINEGRNEYGKQQKIKRELRM